MNYKEAYEKSWDFLRRIVDEVQKRFNKRDMEQVLDLGQELLKAGLVYVHQVVYGDDEMAAEMEKKRRERIESAQHQEKITAQQQHPGTKSGRE